MIKKNSGIQLVLLFIEANRPTFRHTLVLSSGQATLRSTHLKLA